MNRAERLDDGEYPLREGAASLVGFPGPTSQTLGKRPDVPWGSHISESATDPHAHAIDGGRGFRSVLRNPLFLRLWLAQLISQTITNAANYGLIVLVAQQTNSNLGSAFAIVAFALPAALFAAPAGVLVDRFDRRSVLWISNALRALAAFGFVISLLIDSSASVPVLLLSFFMSTVAQFFSPAEGAAIPALVHPQELMNALALFNITFTLAQALGLIILGPAIIDFVPSICFGTCGVGLTITSTRDALPHRGAALHRLYPPHPLDTQRPPQDSSLAGWRSRQVGGDRKPPVPQHLDGHRRELELRPARPAHGAGLSSSSASAAP